MANLNVPGLAGYIQAQEMNQQQQMGQLQQAQLIMGLQDAAQKNARQQAYQQEVDALGANPSLDALAGVVSKYNPEKGLDLRERARDRQEAREQRAVQFAEQVELRRQALDQQREAFLQRTQDAQARQAFEQSYKQQQLVLQQQTAAFNREMKQLGMEITRQGNELRLQRFDVAQREKEDREIEGQISKTVNSMKDIQPVVTAANQLNDILGRYTPENVPGIGYLKNTDTGKAFLSDEGKEVQSSQKLVGNAILKAMAGSAVTAPEEIRQMAAMMADARFSAKDFYIAWPKVAKWINDQAALGAANLSPKARERFVERTKLNLDPIKPRFSFDGKQLVDSRAAPTQGWSIQPVQ